MPLAFEDRGELDLHGLTADEAMETFVHFYNSRVSTGNRDDIAVIHGGTHGDRIRRRLRTFLAQHSDKVRFEPGEHLDGNPGWTKVYPKRKLPAASDLLEGQILDFCQTPRTLTKIIGKFIRHHSDPGIRRAVEKLVKQGQLAEIKGTPKLYEATGRGNDII